MPTWERVSGTINSAEDLPQHFVTDPKTGEVWKLTAASASDERLLVQLVGWSPDGEALVSVTDLNTSALFLAAPSKPFRHLLTVNGSVDAVSWSPDGSLIDAEGRLIDWREGRLVAELDQAPNAAGSWSSDGRYLLFSRRPGEEREWFVWDRESETVRASPVSGTWSNEGWRVAYAAQPPPSGAVGPVEISIYDFDTDDHELVTTVSAQSAAPLGWSYDDRYVAFLERNESISIRIVDMTGGSPDVIVHGAWAATWIPAQHSLLVSGNVCGDFDVFTVDATGDSLRNYTDSSALDLYPRLSPDARHVAITTIEDGESAIRSIDLETGEAETVSSGLGVTLWSSSIPPRVVWSPDGRYLAFGIEGGHGLCKAVVPVDTTVELVE